MGRRIMVRLRQWYERIHGSPEAMVRRVSVISSLNGGVATRPKGSNTIWTPAQCGTGRTAGSRAARDEGASLCGYGRTVTVRRPVDPTMSNIVLPSAPTADRDGPSGPPPGMVAAGTQAPMVDVC